jgi:CheY-like chemotaxis protein
MPRILIADDDGNIRDTLRLMLEDEGYRVAETSDGAATLAYVTSATDRLVVLLDVFMPGSDALLSALGRNPALTMRHAYVLCTAASQAQMPREALRLRFPILRKPFDIDQALAIIATATHALFAPVHDMCNGDEATL